MTVTLKVTVILKGPFTLNKKSILVIGDIIAIAILTVIGFATHGETGTSFLPRMAAVFVPATITWFLLAPWFGLFEKQAIQEIRLFWRIPLAVVFAAPLALVLRGAVLNAPVLPIFVLVFTSTTSLGLLVWRIIYKFAFKAE